MIGTIVNTACIVVGTLVGTFFKKGLGEKYTQVLFNAMGLASIALGVSSFVQNMPKSEFPVLFILSLAIGGLVGTALDLDGRVNRAIAKRGGESLATGLISACLLYCIGTFSIVGPVLSALQGDNTFLYTNSTLDLDGRVNRAIAKRGGESLATGLISACLLYCIGTFSIVGPVLSALQGDNTFLYTNSTLDLVTSTVFATTFGFGMILAAPILFLWQGSIWLIAKLASTSPLLQGTLVNELAIVGGVLILASGLSILKIKDCKTLNYIPALLVPVLWFLIKGLLGL